MKLSIIGVPTYYGCDNNGTQYSPEKLRNANIINLIKDNGEIEVADLGDIDIKEVIEREAPGICEAIRMYSMQITKRAMLSRAVSGIRKDTLIVNLPGSPKACKEALDYALDDIKHGIDILLGTSKECARK